MLDKNISTQVTPTAFKSTYKPEIEKSKMTAIMPFVDTIKPVLCDCKRQH